MSIVSMASRAASARLTGEVPSAGTPPARRPAAVVISPEAEAPVAPAVPAVPAIAGVAAEDPLLKYLGLITAYIPTEAVTVYLGITSLIDGNPNHTLDDEWKAFWFILIFTPTLVWLVYARKLVKAGIPLFDALTEFPLWQIGSATIAFYIWAYALSNGPFSERPGYSTVIAGTLLLGLSPLFGVLSEFFEKIILVLHKKKTS